MVNYVQTVSDVEKTLISRENTDQLLIPLADHDYFENQGGQGPSIRAYTCNAGIFAEGMMSPEQVESLSNTLLNSLNIKLAKPVTVIFDDPCDTEINKAIWDAWKEFGNGAEELTLVANLMQLGVDFPVESIMNGFICMNFPESFAQTVLDKCKPEDICDYNYQYIMNDAMSEMQKCENFGDSLYTVFYSRWAEIRDICIEDGLLKFNLSGNLVAETTTGPETPNKLNMYFNSKEISVPLTIETISVSGFAEIHEDNDMFRGVPLFPLSGSGTIVYFPGRTYERTCNIYSSGYIDVDVAGTKDGSDNYSISIVTALYNDNRIKCPDQQEIIIPISHERTRVFDIKLNSANHYKGTALAVDDPYWSVDVELKLP